MRSWQNMLTRSIGFDDVFYTLGRLNGDSGSFTQAARIHHEIQLVQSRVSKFSEYGDYVPIYLQAAMLLQSLIKHCRADPATGGDTRLAWLLTAIFLELNGYKITHAASDEVSEIIASITDKGAGIGSVSTALQAIAEHPRNEPLFP